MGFNPVDLAFGNISALNASNDKLRKENAKLRELVTGIWHELNAATQYDAGGGRGIVFEYLDRMRELGIEVDA